MTERGWDKPDFVYITGDAYVDHPSFGVSIISRVLEAHGYKVAIVSQPQSDEDYMRFGKPRLGFLITSGNIDSMVAHYTVAKRKRSQDSYSPGGKAGLRPDRAVIVYTKRVKQIYPSSFVMIGGLEASLRRFAHYDYWDDRVRPSVLIDSGADILSFGMGEKQTVEIADRLKDGCLKEELYDIRGICYSVPTKEYSPMSVAECPSYEQVCASKQEYAAAAKIQMEQQDAVRGKIIIQRHGDRILVQNKPMTPLNTDELDFIYSLPYERYYHPMYEKAGGVPGIAEVEFSITHNRGCFGACNFCSIAFHQGRAVTVRSKESVLNEAKKLTENPRFKGYIHDVGGPTANFRKPSCKIQETAGLCKNKKCLAPKPCGMLQVDHSEYLEILREMRKLKGVKKVFIRSGIRFDYLMEDKDGEFFRELVEHHISGQLKVAPEHCCAAVLDQMGKPHIESYIRFANEFYKTTKQIGKEQYLVPYLMSSHPGSTLKDAVELALFLKKERIRPEQVQDFYPTPGTASTCMFYTGINPLTMEKVYVPKSQKEKAMQRALLQYFNPQNRDTVIDALISADREDLIGSSKDSLVPPNGKYRAILAGRSHSRADSANSKGRARSGQNRGRKNGRRKK